MNKKPDLLTVIYPQVNLHCFFHEPIRVDSHEQPPVLVCPNTKFGSVDFPPECQRYFSNYN